MAFQERFENSHVGVYARADIADGHAYFCRSTGVAGNGKDAHLALHQIVVRTHVRVVVVFAIAADRTGDQSRIFLANLLKTKARSLNRAGSKIVDEHVRAVHQRAQKLHVGGLLEIQHRGFLALIEPDEMRALSVRRSVVTAGKETPRGGFLLFSSTPA